MLDYLTRCYQAHLDGQPAPSLLPAASSYSAGLTDRQTCSSREGQHWAVNAYFDGVGSCAVLARRKTIVEPVFGQIKECRGFRRFLLWRIGPGTRGEWRLGPPYA